MPEHTERAAPEPRRWTLHGLNNGAVFGATVALVRRLPRWASYAIGDAATWLAVRTMPVTRDALMDNLRPVLPDASPRALAQATRSTFKSYARDTVDFLRALDHTEDEARALFTLTPEYLPRFQDVLARGRGAILVTGHFGNWELGGLMMTRVLHLPLTIVAMAEANVEVNEIRKHIRSRLGVDTIEVRQALDTALRLRRHLSGNGILAMLMDRHLGRDRVQVSMFGRPVWFLRTPALMGYLSGAPLLPCFIHRDPGKPYAVYLGSPIFVETDRPREEAIQRAAQAFADELSRNIQRHPEYWYQFYRYWDAQRDEYDGLD